MEPVTKSSLQLDEFKNFNDKLTRWVVNRIIQVKLPPDEVSGILKTLMGSKITKKDLKDSQLHATITNLIKTPTTNSNHKRIVEEVELLIIKAKALREHWKQALGSDASQTPEPKTPSLVTKASESPSVQSKIVAEVELPDLYDSNRNTALKRLAAEFVSAATLEQVKKLETEHAAGLSSLDKLKEFILKLEDAMWRKTGAAQYLRFARERIMMLTSKTNQGLKSALLDGSMTVQTFVDSKTEDLEGEEAKARIEEGSRWALAAAQSDFYLKNVTVSEGEFTCSKCKSRKIASFQKQMRSADEPMTSYSMHYSDSSPVLAADTNGR